MYPLLPLRTLAAYVVHTVFVVVYVEYVFVNACSAHPSMENVFVAGAIPMSAYTSKVLYETIGVRLTSAYRVAATY